MRSPLRWRRLTGYALALVAAALFVGGAESADVTYGVSVSKGCASPTLVGQKSICHYVFSNTGATSGDTVTLNMVNDTVTSAGGPVASGNILPGLSLLFNQPPITGTPASPTCTGGSGLGTVASPYVNATSCSVPFGANITSENFSWYTVTGADFALSGNRLHDQVDYNWTDQCDVTPTPATCDGAPDTSDNQATSSTIVEQFTPTITTTIVPASPIVVGQSAHDTAQIALSPNSPPPPGFSGSVTYKLFTNNACTTLSTTPALNSTVAVTGGVVPPSPTVVFPNAGNFWFQATYSGDTADGISGPVTSTCTDEPLVVNPGPSSTVTTVMSGGSPVAAPLPLGSTVTDMATVNTSATGAPPTGNVSFLFFTNGTCAPTGATDGTITLTGNTATSAPAEGPLTAGSYSFQATYNGDANYTGSTGACEPFTVSKANSTHRHGDQAGRRDRHHRGGRDLGHRPGDCVGLRGGHADRQRDVYVLRERDVRADRNGCRHGDALEWCCDLELRGSAHARELLVPGDLQRRYELQRIHGCL